MMGSRRAWTPGACYFFTVATASRKPLFHNFRRVRVLQQALGQVRRRHPFRVDAMVVLPDHMHCIWTLPAGDADFATRWQLIRATVSRACCDRENIVHVWQPWLREHRIRSPADFRAHVDYIHEDPARHGWVRQPMEWPWSSIHDYLRKGRLEPGWGSDGVFMPSCAANVAEL